MYKVCAAIGLIVSIVWVESAFSQDLSLEERIRIGTDAIKNGCTPVSKDTNFDFIVGADGSLTLRKLPNVAANGQIHYSSHETVGLLAALQKETNAGNKEVTLKQLDCMRKYVDRIIDIVLPAPK